MKRLKKAWLTLKWIFGYHHRMYSETAVEATMADAGLDMLAKKLTRGKYSYGRTEMGKYNCKVCGVTFWTLSRGAKVCQRLRCYLEYYLHPKAYQGEIAK